MAQKPTDDTEPNGFDADAYASGWDAAAWNHQAIEDMTLGALADTMGERSAAFEALAAGDELVAPESAAYKAGAAYGYRMAQAALLDLVAARPAARR